MKNKELCSYLKKLGQQNKIIGLDLGRINRCATTATTINICISGSSSTINRGVFRLLLLKLLTRVGLIASQRTRDVIGVRLGLGYLLLLLLLLLSIRVGDTGRSSGLRRGLQLFRAALRRRRARQVAVLVFGRLATCAPHSILYLFSSLLFLLVYLLVFVLLFFFLFFNFYSTLFFVYLDILLYLSYYRFLLLLLLLLLLIISSSSHIIFDYLIFVLFCFFVGCCFYYLLFDSIRSDY